MIRDGPWGKGGGGGGIKKEIVQNVLKVFTIPISERKKNRAEDKP